MKLNYIKDEIDRMSWLNGLNPEEKLIAELSLIVQEQIILKYSMGNGCYLNAFFLRKFLKNKFNINVEIIVGWIANSILHYPRSHAWILFNNKITDITLWNAANIEGDFSGSLIIHDAEYKHGKIKYQYNDRLTPLV